MFRARKVASHLAEIISIKECVPQDMNILEQEEFPIKAKWSEGSISLAEQLNVRNHHFSKFTHRTDYSGIFEESWCQASPHINHQPRVDKARD